VLRAGVRASACVRDAADSCHRGSATWPRRP